MDAIAKQAGVGPGTLYRHFPTREALVDAVMKDWADRVNADAGDVIARDLPSRELLTDWLARFFDHVSRYQGAAAKFAGAMDDPDSPMYRKCSVLAGANAAVLDAIDARGDLREGVEAREVMRVVTGIAAVADQQGKSRQQSMPMLTIVADGVLRA
jgi:AcrR family transcriptional regulator